ncbi:MAG: branched-chain amino acid ABC transporter permease [Deltaproteobacteria bacterium]|nr:branched-chain amino acid ABC transporter permease [Deltaproteobacteria bacterium]MBW2049661.1 branched-chain amino acid ABC transporter permease [Deltaproteobacteria bacterium]MBW2110110.1 branched-chain amino acid ABC transporter permease [Deltaproteobacteria bacterium]MBW2354561.1 branched-chain amino acid ABC transporter permease [Deltaproteobacteria bacterium]HDZ91195.1 branched-chain amino acid ABC transporter permease [Deltaproteobacteria bacterium]
MENEFLFFMQFLLSGLSMGSIYALVALGFVLIYKATSILNLAQGEFLMVGAYVCLSITLDLGLNFLASFMLTMVFSVILGLAVERLVLRPLIGEPIISVIMVTLGLTYILRGLVIMIWGNDIRQFNIFPEQPVDFWGVKLTYLYLYSMGISLVLLTVFALFFKYARAGIFMRAVADHQTAAQSMGISVKRVFAMSWCIAAVVSSIGGILVGNIAGVGVDLSYIGLKVLPAVILGGLDSILGAIIGGLIVGVLEFLSAGYLDPYIPAINEVFPFIVLVLVLMIKPYGLFGIEEIERV